VWGICSPTYANISRRNLQYPGACSGDSLFGVLLGSLGFLITCASGPKFVAGTDIPVNKDEDFETSPIEKGVSIRGYLGESTTVGIPARIKGKPVTVIFNAAFRGKGLTAVGIPNSVLIIYDAVFQKNQLTSIHIPSKVRHISTFAFAENSVNRSQLA
jgi:hypothetical protein